VKEGSGDLSPYGPHWDALEGGGAFTGNSETVEGELWKRSISLSLSLLYIWALCEGNLGT
jgi:hypothetical protein